MEFTQLIRLIRKWIWLIIVAAFIGGGISFIINTRRPPQYSAKVIISIGRFIEARNPDQSDIRIGFDLAQTYAHLVRTNNVLQGTIDALSLPLQTNQLNNLINTNILTGTSLLEVSVTYTDAILAADIANGLADQLILESPSNLTPQQQGQLDFANEQIAGLTTQISDTRAELQSVSDQLEIAQDPNEIARLTEQRNALVSQINQASATVAQFTDTVNQIQQNTNALNVVEQATIPNNPTGVNTLTLTILGALGGAALAAAGIFVIEYLDETIRNTEEAAQTLKLPILGAVMRIGKKNVTPDEEMLITSMSSMSPIAESYRTIRTNLLFSASQTDTDVYIVTSPSPQEGKTVTTANLAISMAMAGLQVLLIDADLRRPRIHEMFNLDNNVGLTTLLSAEPYDLEGMPEGNRLPANLLDCIQSTSLPKLWVITSGFTPANPTEILGSTLLQRWMDIFRASSDIDVVLIDTPPCLAVADSTVLAATSGANVVLVVNCGSTRRGTAIRSKEQFQQLGITIKGVVANRINLREQGYDYGYDYGYGYYYAPQASDAKKNGNKGVRNYLGSREK